MTTKELSEYLKTVPEWRTLWSLDITSIEDDCLFLTQDHSCWILSYRERGKVKLLCRYDSEDEACRALVARLEGQRLRPIDRDS